MKEIDEIDHAVASIDRQIDKLKDERRALRLARKVAVARLKQQSNPGWHRPSPDLRGFERRWLLQLGGYPVSRMLLGPKRLSEPAIASLIERGLVNDARQLTDAGIALAAIYDADPRRQCNVRYWTPERKKELSDELKERARQYKKTALPGKE